MFCAFHFYKGYTSALEDCNFNGKAFSGWQLAVSFHLRNAF